MDRKHLACQIFSRTLEAVAPSAAIERGLSISGHQLRCSDRNYDLRCFPDVRVLAVGKAAHGMLDGLLAILRHDARLRGVVSAPTTPPAMRSGFHYFLSGHPEPNEHSLLAGKAALELVSNSTPQTMMIVLL